MVEVKRVRLGDVAYEYKERIGEEAPDRPVYGVDKSVGLTAEPRYQSSNLSRYKRIEHGMFAYNPMRLNIGSIGFCHDDLAPGIVSPDYVVFGCHEGALLPKFMDYHTSSAPWSDWLSLAGEGSVRERIYFRKLETYELALPDVAYQEAAVEILSSLDNKIELNRRMNDTLEALAQAVFKDWFVSFGPTRRKAEGEADPVAILGGLIPDPAKAAPLAALFPDSFGDDGLPEGWEEASLGDVISVFDSKRIPLSARQREAKRGAFPYHGAAGVMDYVDEFLFEGVHVLVGEDGSVIDPNGKPVLQYVWGQFWVNNHAHVLQGRGISTEHLLCFLRQIEITPFVTGAVQPKLSQGNLKRVPFVLAKEQVLQGFAQQIAPLFELVRSNVEQNRTLAETRDYLVPKLMSGAVRVRDTDAMAE